jgi:hypothetical protein
MILLVGDGEPRKGTTAATEDMSIRGQFVVADPGTQGGMTPVVELYGGAHVHVQRLRE